ncbi:hypothetical protein [Mediterraneibacter agrestimuris]|nr:hypothetical protein [Mediterraneibacter agrestimuris]
MRILLAEVPTVLPLIHGAIARSQEVQFRDTAARKQKKRSFEK